MFTGILSAPMLLFAQNSEDTPAIQEIVVKGEKIERSLQETVSSVAVFDAETIDSQNFTDVFDLVNQTANVTGIGADTGFAIRGLRNSGVGGTDATSDVATVYLDGVFLPSSLFTQSPLNLWDIDSVEIFRGPQSTVQGRNALIGAISARTVDPGSEFSGRAQVRFADFGSLRTSGALSIPLVRDQLAVRVSADFTETDGFVENINLGTDDASGGQTTTSRAKFLFTPKGAPRFLARLNITNIDVERESAGIEEILFPNQLVTFQNIANVNDSETSLTSLELSYEFNDIFSLTSVSSFIDTDRTATLDLDASGADGGAIELLTEDVVFSQELRLNFQTDRWSGLLGLFYFDSSNDDQNFSVGQLDTGANLPSPNALAQIAFDTSFPTPDQIAEAAFLAEVFDDLVPEFDFEIGGATSEDIENSAIFGEVQYNLNDKLRISFGARFDFENIVQDFSVGQSVPPIIFAVPAGLLDPAQEILLTQLVAETGALFSSETLLDADNDFSAFLPKGVVTYDWTENISTSFSVQRAYRAGGLSFNDFQINNGIIVDNLETQEELEAAGIVNSFDPEFTTNFELSFRSQWFERRLTINANIFYIDYEDQQIDIELSENPLDALTGNVGNSRLQGFEIEAFATPIDGLDLFFNVGVTDTEFLDNTDLFEFLSLTPDATPQDLTGNRFEEAPGLTLGLGGRYEHSTGLFGNLRIRYNDEAEGDEENSLSTIIEAHTIVDAIIGYEINDYFAVEVFADNLLDEQFLANNPPAVGGAIAIGAFAVPGRQRTIGARIGFEF